MTTRNRLLSAAEVQRLDGQSAARNAVLWEELKELRKQRKFKDNYRTSARLFQFPDEREIDEGIASGKMRFFDSAGKSHVEIPLETERGTLVMPFMIKADSGTLVCSLRYSPDKFMLNLQLENDARGPGGFVFAVGNFMGHMAVNPIYAGRGLALPMEKIARDHAMAKYGAAKVERSSIERVGRFTDIFERAGYEHIKGGLFPSIMKRLGLGGFLAEDDFYAMRYPGDPNAKNNLDTHYRFIALDPISGKKRSIYREKNNAKY
jgi:hypothetical protein